ncbi:MAG: hypothetical protein IIU96_02975 [Paludibacteraceae bacterium]|nr:hypothetical protein [Paludibacteraceae bacterium]
MAKGSAMGLWRGKKGSSVFYKIKNSNSAQKQGIRERVYEVSNPKSSAQASQRMKMAPAQAFFNALADILNRGAQGTKYGGLTRQEFMSYALKMTTGFPFVQKGESDVVPGAYRIAKGNLGEIQLDHWDNGQNATSVVFSYGVGDFSEFASGGTIDNESLTAYVNGGGKEGDQVTLIACVYNGTSFGYGYGSFFVRLGEQIPNVTIFGLNVSFDDGQMAMNAAQGYKFVGAGVIVSRLGSNNEYQRSTSIFAVNVSELQEWFAPSVQGRARASYMSTSKAASSNWPVQPEIPENQYDSVFQLSGLTGAQASLNGSFAKVRRYLDSDNLAAVYGGQGSSDPSAEYDCVIDEEGNVLEYVAEMEQLPLLISAVTAFNGLPVVPFTMGA